MVAHHFIVLARAVKTRARPRYSFDASQPRLRISAPFLHSFDKPITFFVRVHLYHYPRSRSSRPSDYETSGYLIALYTRSSRLDPLVLLQKGNEQLFHLAALYTQFHALQYQGSYRRQCHSACFS